MSHISSFLPQDGGKHTAVPYALPLLKENTFGLNGYKNQDDSALLLSYPSVITVLLLLYGFNFLMTM